MSATSIKNDFVVPAAVRDGHEQGSYRTGDGSAAHREPPLLDTFSLAGLRKPVLETLAFLAVAVVLQRWFFGAAETPGLPHLYWLPVLLASCQYGLSGGMIAAAAASAVYWFGLSPPSAAQDFYTYAGTVAIQPAAWLATALVIGGLRNLHIHQSREMADQLAACRRRANDLSNGLERAAAEINALERRIAIDTGTVAALSRSLSLIDMSDRRAAAASYGELFHVGTGAATLTVYLKQPDGYVPVWAVEEDTVRATKSMPLLPSTAIDAMMSGSAVFEVSDDPGETEPAGDRHVVRVPSFGGDSEPLAVFVCYLDRSQDVTRFRRRADELSGALATILHACPDQPSGART
jgi:K+-sensing histidine kinase KdpD